MNAIYEYEFERETDWEREFIQSNKGLESARDHMEGLVEMLASPVMFDANEMEWHLDEICGALDISLAGKKQIICKKIFEALMAVSQEEEAKFNEKLARQQAM